VLLAAPRPIAMRTLLSSAVLLFPAAAVAPALIAAATSQLVEPRVATSNSSAKVPCHGCGHACDANCNCGVCKMDRCKTESLCMGPCNAGHNAKWCGGAGPPAPPPGPPAPPPLPPAHHTSFTAGLNIKQCTKSGCTPVKKRIALDASSNHTSGAGTSLIEIGGAGLDQLTLTYGGATVGGPSVYLIEEEGVNKNHLFMLKGQEFTFDVELSTMPCGFNAGERTPLRLLEDVFEKSCSGAS
jgi:hypothetical protein